MEHASRRQHVEALIILAALVLMVYANSFESGFVVDGRPLILESARVHSVSRQHLKEILFHSYTWPAFNSGLYRPATTLSYLLNFAILKDLAQPAGYHWFNVLLHAANAFLVYLLALLLVRQYWPAVFAAALWALHPICTEAVTNIAGRPEELAAFGMLAALVLYVRGGPKSVWRRICWMAAIAGSATLAVFSKEGAVMLLALAALYDFTYRNLRKADWSAYVFLGLPVLTMLCVRWLVLRHDGVMETQFVDNPISGSGFLAGRLTALGVIGKYLWLLFWPRTLSCDYSYNQIPVFHWPTVSWQQWAVLATFVGMLVSVAVCYRKSRTGFFLMGFSALTLLPTANLLFTTGTIMAERLLYLPAVGFASAVALGVYRLARRLRVGPMAAALALSAIGVAYGARTFERNPDWKDGETLYVSAVGAAPASLKPHLSLADTWYNLDPTFLNGDRAITEAERAVEIIGALPDRDVPAVVLAVLGKLYCARGDVVASKDADGNPHADAASAVWYNKALDVDLRAVPVDRAFDQENRRKELARGTPAAEIGLAGRPDVYSNLGRVYLRLDDPQAAMQAFLYERRLSPRRSQTYVDIASADVPLHKLEEAATAMLEAYTLDGSPATLGKLSKLYGKLESGGCAMTHGEEGPLLNRDCAIVRHDLCVGYRDLAQGFRDARQRDLVEVFESASRRVPGCE